MVGWSWLRSRRSVFGSLWSARLFGHYEAVGLGLGFVSVGGLILRCVQGLVSVAYLVKKCSAKRALTSCIYGMLLRGLAEEGLLLTSGDGNALGVVS